MRRLLPLLGWPEPHRVLLSLLIALLAGGYAWFFLLPILSPHVPRADDFQDYLFAAQQIRNGADPSAGFVRNHVAWDWSLSSGYLYPPLFATFLLPLTSLSNDLAVRVWLLLMQAAVFASLVIIYRTIGRPSRTELLALTALLLTFFPLANSAAAGTMNATLLLLLTGAWACWLRRRDLSSGLLVGIAAVFKLFPLALVPYLAWRRQWRILIALTLTLFAGVGIGFLVTTPSHNIYYFGEMLPHLSAGTGFRENQSIAGFTARLCNSSTSTAGGGAGWCGRVLDWPAVAALLLLVLYASRRSARTGLEFALAVCALPLISSVTWSFHLVVLLLPITLLIRQVFLRMVSRAAGRALLLAWLCFSVGPAVHYLLIVHPLPSVAGRFGFLPIVITRFFGESYFLGMLLVLGSVWHQLRKQTAVSESTPEFSAAA